MLNSNTAIRTLKSSSDIALFFVSVFAALIISSCRSDSDIPNNTKILIEELLTKGTIIDFQNAMEEGRLSAKILTEYFLEQITLKNNELCAVIAVNPKALEIAEILDKERAEGKIRSQIHGIPIFIKDNIETEEQATTAGSLALINNFTNKDAFIIKKLREAGAVILGKTNLSEWANFRSERSSSGWSAVGGQTKNPYDITKSPCGSSSGSGAAVAAGLAVAAIGTETDGSITCPSSINGLVGIKPTVGLVSRSGIVPISHTQDVAGPMSNNVIDAAIILSIIQDYDEKDPVTSNGEDFFKRDYIDSLNENGLNGKRIGILRSEAGFHEGVDSLFESSIEKLKNEGAVLVDSLGFNPYNGFYGDTYKVLLYQFKYTLNKYFSGLPNDLDSLTLEKLIQFNKKFENKEMPYFKQEIFEKSQAMGSIEEEEYMKILNRVIEETGKNGIDALVDEYKLDALIAPTASAAWSIDLINGDHYIGGFSTYPAVCGYPHITVPMGNLFGLPVGISFTGKSFSEDKLISIAYSFEQSLQK